MKKTMACKSSDTLQRVHIEIGGLVQGVGFRPFVYQLAQSLSLKGKVWNTPQGVEIEAEGSERSIEQLLMDLKKKKPSVSFIQSFQYVYLDPTGYQQFKIIKSQNKQQKAVWISPDLATCPQCLIEIFNPQNRRHLYPFTNCTLCGPRYSIVEKIPYDRCHTSMKKFEMCPACQQEYDDPTNRRFHAQPNACPECGPQLALWNQEGKPLQHQRDVITQSVSLLKKGKVLAVKGLGGFHLMADACNDKAVALLRKRKCREEKPFALMFPSIQSINATCLFNLKEKEILCSSESPIVLLKKRKTSTIPLSRLIAFDNPFLGAMLPYTPLHHILLNAMKSPLIATSGNLSDEPICIDEKEAVKKLSPIADMFLVHNRPIVRPVDDSIVRLVNQRPLVLRRARGYAPLGVTIKKKLSPVLAYGAFLKNTVALGVKNQVFLSQHIGDIETKESLNVQKKTALSLSALYDSPLESMACDLHPDFSVPSMKRKEEKTLYRIQHHHAHIAACMAENELTQQVLGIAWDGTGYGTDGTIWGGEFIVANYRKYKRIVTLFPFRLPGGDKAIKEPKRTALSLLYSIYGRGVERFNQLSLLKMFSLKERRIFYTMLEKEINAPLTSSMGRLFDGISSLLGVAHENRYEGQAAMMLEHLTEGREEKGGYSFSLSPKQKTGERYLFWNAMIEEIVQDLQKGEIASTIAKKFHNTLAEMVLSVAQLSKKKTVVLSGGCFQNKYLTEKVVQKLQNEKFSVYTHQRVPPNDGGIALGQAIIAGMQ